MELISSLPPVEREINLSIMIINKIQNHALHELVDSNLRFNSDYKTCKMLIFYFIFSITNIVMTSR